MLLAHLLTTYLHSIVQKIHNLREYPLQNQRFPITTSPLLHTYDSGEIGFVEVDSFRHVVGYVDDQLEAFALSVEPGSSIFGYFGKIVYETAELQQYRPS